MNTLAIFNRMKKLPGGTRLFTLAVCRMAPYFTSISPLIEDLQPGYARISMRKQRKVENHLHTVHAIAMCNMAELVGGLMTEVSVPDGARWIPSAMTVAYRKKALTDLVAVAKGEGIDWQSGGEVVVPVKVMDRQHNIVFTAAITMNIKLKS